MGLPHCREGGSGKQGRRGRRRPPLQDSRAQILFAVCWDELCKRLPTNPGGFPGGSPTAHSAPPPPPKNCRANYYRGRFLRGHPGALQGLLQGFAGREQLLAGPLPGEKREKDAGSMSEGEGLREGRRALEIRQGGGSSLEGYREGETFFFRAPPWRIRSTFQEVKLT